MSSNIREHVIDTKSIFRGNPTLYLSSRVAFYIRDRKFWALKVNVKKIGENVDFLNQKLVLKSQEMLLLNFCLPP